MDVWSSSKRRLRIHWLYHTYTMYRVPRYKMIFRIFFFLVFLIAIYVYSHIHPSSSPLFPKCPFLMLTGMKCPGCGSQRALHALLHADIKTAFSYNPLLLLSIPYVILLVGVRIYQLFNPYSTLILKVQKNLYIWMFFAIAMIFFVARNIFNF